MAERRRWPRLPLAIPVFVKGRAGDHEFLEFSTALNVSAGGMLIAVRHAMLPDKEVSLEIPSAPLIALSVLPHAVRTLRAKVLRMVHVDAYNLLALKFARPLIDSPSKLKTLNRRQVSVA
jgi:hypothetical protein